MTTHQRQRCLALRIAVGAAAVASAALVSGAADAQFAQPAMCSAASDLSPTGRQFATLTPASRPVGVCIRHKLRVPADPSVPDCWTTARTTGMVCVQIIDDN